MIVLPGELVFPSPEARAAEAGLRHAVVAALPHAQVTHPERSESVGAREREGFDGGRRLVVETRRCIEPVAEPAVIVLSRNLVFGIEPVRQAGARVCAVVSIAIRVVRKIGRVGDRIEAARSLVSALERVSERALRPAEARRRLARPVGPVARARIERGRPLAATREHLDDAAHRIGSIKARRRSAQDLDVVDKIERDCLERGRSRSRRPRAHPVNQHEGLVAVDAAKEDGAG